MDKPLSLDPSGKIGLRRLRQSRAIRELTREVRPSHAQMIQPHFVVEGIRERESISGMRDVYRETTETLLNQVEKDLKAGIGKILLFSVPVDRGTNRFSFDFSANQIAALKRNFGDSLWLSADVCLCSHTTHGHCGILNESGDHIQNDLSVSTLAEQAVAFAEAGADCVAPSDMMDGRIGVIREMLSRRGHERTLIMSYSAKFCSKFYGPFREAAESAPKGTESKLKDRASYQIDPSRPKDAYLSSLRDSDEGADILMVKPGLCYLDVLKELSVRIAKPWAVYQVSGEYAAIELMADQGLMDRRGAHLEVWTAFVRAGASIIITYAARWAREWMTE